MEKAEKVRILFEDAQNAVASHKSGLQQLVKLIDSHESLREIVLLDCIDKLLLCSKKEATVERAIKFATSLIPLVSLNNLIEMTKHLLERSGCVDKTVRLRACQILAGSLSKMEAIPEALSEHLIHAMKRRICDKIGGIRSFAVLVLKPLQTGEETDEVMDAIIEVMKTDPSSEVRSVATDCVLVCQRTLPLLLGKVRDVSPDVRIAALRSLLKATDIRHLPAAMRATVLRYGLGDREASVKNEAVRLVLRWLELLEYNVVRMFKLVGLIDHEAECRLLAQCLIEEVESPGSSATSQQKNVVRNCIPNYQNSLKKLSPYELFWAEERVRFAKAKMTAGEAAEWVSVLLPDVITVCDVLSSCSMDSLEDNESEQLSVQYLLQLCKYQEDADSYGAQRLQEICFRLIENDNLPEYLVHSVLFGWSYASQLLGKPYGQVFQFLMEFASKRGVSSSGTELTIEEELALIRQQQVTIWALKQHLLVSGCSDVVPEHVAGAIESLADSSVHSLQNPSSELRVLAVQSLGLLGFCFEQYSSYQELLYQAASSPMEDSEVRAVALQCLSDYASIKTSQKNNDNAFAGLIDRLMNANTNTPGYSSVLQKVAAETGAKLLFTGRLNDSHVFARLLKVFFLVEASNKESELSEGDEDFADMGQRDNLDILIGSDSRLHQLLSVLFHSYMQTGGDCDKVILDSVSEMIADVCLRVRDGSSKSSEVGKLCAFVCNVCSQPRSSDTEQAAEANTLLVEARLRIAASICRELLKLGQSRTEKAIAKDLAKLLCLQDFEELVAYRPDLGTQIHDVIGAVIHGNAFDKTTLKLLEGSQAKCLNSASVKPVCEGHFVDFAPGLANLLGISSDDEGETVVGHTNSATTQPKPTRLKRQGRSKRAVVESSSSEEDNGDEESCHSDEGADEQQNSMKEIVEEPKETISDLDDKENRLQRTKRTCAKEKTKPKRAVARTVRGSKTEV